MNKTFITFLYVTVVLLAIAIGSVVVRDAADILADISRHVMYLFRYADIRPSHSRGFSSFVQLILIAAFVGWAIRRFRGKK
jgi:hypothetical protein